MRSSTTALVGAITAAALAAPARARACGVATGGAAGISGCSLEEHEEALRPRWEAGAEYSFTDTSLSFTGGRQFAEQRQVALATLDYAPTRRTAVRAGAGVLAGGDLSSGGTRFAFTPGFVGVLAASWRVLDAAGARPFVLLTGQLSYAGATVGGADYGAFDLRAGVIVGESIAGVLTPYVVGRAFGGPVFWRVADTPVTGTDVHHYQVGAGVALRVGKRFDVFAEGSPLGERGLAAGLGWSL